MFNNIGRKIKTLAKVICWICIVIFFIYGILIMIKGAPFLGILVFVLGSFISWIASFMTYGFGQLIENSDILVSQGRNRTNAKATADQGSNKVSEQPSAVQMVDTVNLNPVIAQNDNVCPNCKQTLSADSAFCTHCGFKIPTKTNKHICPSCGTVSKEDSVFCTQCGNKFS